MSNNSRREKPRKLRRHLLFESMESRRLLAADVFQHNFDMPDDVNGDQYVSPMDALAVINHLNSSSSHSSNISNSLASGELAQAVTYLDVNNDGFVSPMDALSIINALNSTSSKSVPATTTVTTAPTTAATTPTTTAPTSSTNCDDDDASEGNEAAETEQTITTNLVANLTGSGAGTGTAMLQFTSGTVSGAAQTELDVYVSGATPSSTLDVMIADVLVGTVNTTAAGNGYLALASVPTGQNETALPANFPLVAADTTASVGSTLTGAFATATNTGEVDQQGENEGQLGDQNDAIGLPDAETNDDGVVTTPPDTTIPKTTPPVTTPVTSTPTTTTPTSSVPTTTTSVSQRLVSTLQGTGAETARVVFESGTENGVAQNELKVRVRNSTPSSTLDVAINGMTVGSVATDVRGNGALQLATVPNGTSELPLPADFPAVAAAATVQIGPTMTGTLAVPTNTNPYVNHEGHGEHHRGDDGEHDHEDHGGGGSRDAGETQFASVLTGTGSQLGYVQFESETHRGTLKSELGISVNSLTPNASLDVIIDNITVGQIVTDANGHGDLDLSSLPRGTNELPLPANFPVIAAGSSIQIGTELSGTFTANPNNPTLPTTTTPAAVTLQPQRLTLIGQGNSHHRSRHR